MAVSNSNLATGWPLLVNIRHVTAIILFTLAIASLLADRIPKALFWNLRRHTKAKKHGFCTEEVPMFQPEQEPESVNKVGALATTANISAAK